MPIRETWEAMKARMDLRKPAPSRPPPKPKFRFIDEGQGGILHFDLQSPQQDPIHNTPLTRLLIPWVGTYGCRTCVGVYFKIDETRAFVAHINAWKQILSFYGHEETTREVTDQEGQDLKEKVLILLQRTAYGNFYPDEIDKSSIIIVCPWPTLEDKPEVKLTGWWIIKAIEDFLEIPKPIYSNHSGFVVHHETGEKRLFAFDPDDVRGVRPPLEVKNDFIATDEYPQLRRGPGPWIFDLEIDERVRRSHA